MSLRNRVINHSIDKIILRLRTTHEMMAVEDGGGLFNASCFRNVVQYVKDNKDSDKNPEIVECIFIDGGVPILHYVIFEQGVYREITLGWESKLLEYYYIRTISPTDYDHIVKEFQRSQKFWTETYCHAWLRKIFKIKNLI